MEFLFIMILEFYSQIEKNYSFELGRYASIDACEKARAEIQNEITKGNYFVRGSDGYDVSNRTAVWFACTPVPKK